MQKSAPGFTLIESIIYFAILGILLLAFGAVLFQTLSAKNQSQTVVEIGDSARIIMERMSSAIRSADAITDPEPGESSDAITLVMADVAKNPTQFSVTAGTLMIQEGASAATAMHGDEITVSALTFTNVAYPDTPGAIRITMTVSSNGSGSEYDYQETFYTTVVPRKK